MLKQLRLLELTTCYTDLDLVVYKYVDNSYFKKISVVLLMNYETNGDNTKKQYRPNFWSKREYVKTMEIKT